MDYYKFGSANSRSEQSMKLLMLRSVWSGSSNLDELIRQTIKDGFDGLESPIPKEIEQCRKLRKKFYSELLVQRRM